MQQTDHTVTIFLPLLAIFVTLAVPVIGYVLTNLHKNISAVDKSAKERHEVHTQAIEATEKRTTAYIHDVEARAVERVKEAEARAEKGDERILAAVNSQYADLKGDLRSISDNVQRLTREGCGALALCREKVQGN